jgi:hypothetical protein
MIGVENQAADEFGAAFRPLVLTGDNKSIGLAAAGIQPVKY